MLFNNFSSIQKIPPSVQQKWNNVYINNIEYAISPLQSMAWFRVIKKTYPRSFVLINEGENIFWPVQVFQTRAGYIGWIRHAYVPVSSLLKGNTLYLELRQLLNMLKISCRMLPQCSSLRLLRIQPRIRCIPSVKHLCGTPKALDIIKPRISGFYFSTYHDFDFENTILIDLEKPLRVSRTVHRYYNKGKKLGLHLVESDEIYKFLDFARRTQARKGFLDFGGEYLYNKYRILKDYGLARLFFVKYNRELIYGALYIGDKHYIIYDNGGGSPEYLWLNPAYFLHYAVLIKLQQEGYRFFDFGGVTNSRSLKHPLYKNSIIKFRFGGEAVSFVHTLELPLRDKLLFYLRAVYTYARNKRLGWYN